MTLLYSTILGFVKYLKALEIVPSKNTTDPEGETSVYSTSGFEIVGTGNDNRLIFFFKNIGIIEGTYILYYGNDDLNLTLMVETTDYSVDLDSNRVTLTSAGKTAVGTNKIFAEYKYNRLGLLNSEMSNQLEFAEAKVLRDTEQNFANFTDADPGYKQIVDEIIQGPQSDDVLDSSQKVYEPYYNPLIDFETTTDGAFTLGDTTLTLTSGSGLPLSGTLYVDKNKVSYTGRSTNDITVPNDTPSIDDGSVVRAEVLELSRGTEGSAPSYTVLEPGIDYKFDYFLGRFRILAGGLFNELVNSSDEVLRHDNTLIRLSYMSAYRVKGKDPEVPEDIELVTYEIAGKRSFQAIIQNKYIDGMDEFRPSFLKVADEDIESILIHYKSLNVGTSPFNRQNIS